ncbi:Rne/Rng family ribonuclease [uncultured Tyzzerella sp.]|uniref:Rne/Rng family ribonuclease n=1 Tax=uncultured Tyzzerella sp. TaxID=2321398 RepID=UPI00294202B3|nr:Rne/Rng family ribonuclease [uncultured Tyzzerella sp.]
MNKTLVIDALFNYERAGLLENNELKEVIIEEKDSFQVGDIFVGKVKKILPNKFAFIDLGYNKNAFLGITDKKQRGLYIFNERSNKYVLGLKEGQDILVQIDKQGTEIKGASVTTNLTLTGKYVVLLLNEKNIAISKKIDDKEKREFLKQFAIENLPKDYGIIFRTNCYNTDTKIIKDEILYLIKKAKDLMDKANYIKPPTRLFFAKTEIEKIIIDILDKDDKVITNSKDSYNSLKQIFENIDMYNDKLPIFEAYGIESKIEKAFNNKVWLKSGGFLVIDFAEAMTIIDVNTGKNITKSFDDMIFKTNKEALEQISKEIRIRNISGIILIDLIDMKNEEHKKQLELYMRQLAKSDRMPINIYPINELGIMQVTRKKSLKPLYDIVSKVCPMCNGTGKVKNEVYIANIIKNQILSIFSNTIYNKVVVSANNNVIQCLKNIDINNIEDKKIEFNIIYPIRFDYFNIEKFVD